MLSCLSFLVCFWFFGFAPGMGKFPGQGLNLCHSSDPSHSSENAKSLTPISVFRWKRQCFVHIVFSYGNLHLFFLLHWAKYSVVELLLQENNSVFTFLFWSHFRLRGKLQDWYRELRYDLMNDSFFFFFFLSFLPFLGLLPQHMEVPRLGVQSEL